MQERQQKEQEEEEVVNLKRNNNTGRGTETGPSAWPRLKSQPLAASLLGKGRVLVVLLLPPATPSPLQPPPPPALLLLLSLTRCLSQVAKTVNRL